MRHLAAFLLGLAVVVPAHAQPATDALSRCLAENTTGKDRKDLARWVYFAISAHPEIKQYAQPDAAAAADDSQRRVAALFTRLLTDQCPKETTEAVRQGGVLAIQVGFQNLGQLAMQELMSDKDVGARMSGFQQYLDQEKLNRVLTPK